MCISKKLSTKHIQKKLLNRKKEKICTLQQQLKKVIKKLLTANS